MADNPDTLLGHLDASLLREIIVPVAVRQLLDALQVTSSAPGDRSETGKVTLGVDQGLGGLSLNLTPPPGDRDYFIDYDAPPGPRSSFTVAVSLNEGPAAPLFKLVADAAGRVLKPARRAVDPADPTVEWLESAGGDVVLKGTTVWLIVRGARGGAATLSFSPSRTGHTLVHLEVDPQTVLIGGTAFGIEFTDGITLDFADDAHDDGQTMVADDRPPHAVDTPADHDAWQGLVARAIKLYLPRDLPCLGGHGLAASLQVGWSPPGISMSVTSELELPGDRPPIHLRLECMDPTATGLSSFVPTLVEAWTELPLGRSQAIQNVPAPLTFLAGAPVVARARYARKPGDAAQAQEFTLSIEGQGSKGLASIRATDLPGKIVVTAATLGTALAADAGAGRSLGSLLGFVGAGLSSWIADGEFVLHGARLSTAGRALPAGRQTFALDYSVSTQIQQLRVGPLDIGMESAQPLRLRVRDLSLTYDAAQAGLAGLQLDFDTSTMEVEDPGRWTTGGSNLFDVLGTRSGKGSFWFELDLAFRLDLGPVKVSGATVRATVDREITARMSGISASLDLPGLVHGDGKLLIESPVKYTASLDVTIDALGIAAGGGVARDGEMVDLDLHADFPGPLPLADSGLAIYGLGGTFCANGAPDVRSEPGQPPTWKDQVDWASTRSFAPRSGTNSYGLQAVVGTAADLGFTFSAIAGVMVTAPAFGLRAAMEATLMGKRRTLDGAPPDGAAQAQGILVIDGDAVALAVHAHADLPLGLPFVAIDIPISSRFPRAKPPGAPPGDDPRDWYIHLGADGYPGQGRESGPIRAVVFPKVLNQEADAFLMVRGNGLNDFPPGQGNHQGTLTAFGFGFHFVIGVRHVVWAEVRAAASFLLTMDPVSFVGQGTLGGRLGIGIFSIGIDAKVDFIYVAGNVPETSPWVNATVCGRVDLLFHEVHKCVKLSINKPATLNVPDPPCPLDDPAGCWLVDDHYRPLPQGRLTESADDAPVGWPDAIPLLVFSTAPMLNVPDAATNLSAKDLNRFPDGNAARPLGNARLHATWTLLGVVVVDHATGQRVAGPLSCAWQMGKTGLSNEQAQPAELALLTPDNAIWLNALADAGAGLHHGPLARVTDGCQAVAPTARASWAVGALAVEQEDGWRMDSDPHSADPLQSRFSIVAKSFAKPSPDVASFVATRSLVTLANLPPPFHFRDPQLVPLDALSFDGHAFDAALQPGALGSFGGPRPEAATAELRWDLQDMANPLILAETLLYLPRADDLPPAASAAAVLRLVDAAAVAWVLVRAARHGAGWLVGYRSRVPAVSTFSILFDAGIEVTLLGVHGRTHDADDAARSAQMAATRLAEKRKSPPTPPTDETKSSEVRCVLEPGKTYRIDVDLTWEIAGDYPRVAPAPVRKTYFFRTAPAASRVFAVDQSVAQFGYVFRSFDMFNPDMIERYLLGYMPAQGTSDWFMSDPVRIHFMHGHVAALAAAYGYTLACKVRRLDTGEEHEVAPQGLQYPTSTALMHGAQRQIAAAVLQSTCGYKPPGLLWCGLLPDLLPLTWYEIFLQLRRRDAAPDTDGLRIGSASFRTSRWAGAAGLLSALGFVAAPLGPGAAGGDAEVLATVAAPQLSLDSDAGFDDLLAQYGLEGWPPPREARVTHLWTGAGGWRYVGLLVEAPEPLHRPGRLELAPAGALAVAPAVAAFDIHARDRSGCRLLFATTQPFVPAAGTVLNLTCKDLGPVPADALTGRMAVPVEPVFAKEAA